MYNSSITVQTGANLRQTGDAQSRGSVKDRLAKYLIERAMEDGRLHPGDQIVEATAGNTGIGLAIVANHYDIKCIIFCARRFSEEDFDYAGTWR